MKDFYVSLNSKNGMIGSTHNDFTSILAKPISLKESWEFALTEIYFGKNPTAVFENLHLFMETKVTQREAIRTIPKPQRILPLNHYEVKNTEGETVAKLYIDETLDSLKVTIEKKGVLIKSLDFKIPESELDIGEHVFNERLTDERVLAFDFEILITEQYVDDRVIETKSEFKFKDLLVQLNAKLPKGSLIIESTIFVGEHTTLHLSDALAYVLSLDTTVLTHGTHDFISKKLDQISTLYVLCDLASPQFVDGEQIQLLRASSSNGEFFRPYYIPLQRSVFQSLRMYIKTDTGLSVHFDAETSTRAVLHFRRC